MSMAPFSSRNSARWKPGGSFSRTVCSMTRGPAKPTSALGSAITTSPRKAKLAETPPMVGSVSTEKYGSRSAPSRLRAAVVLAICISDSRPSCIRAPPEAAIEMNGQRFSSARSTPRAKRSPTTEPIEPPMKSNSKQAATTGSPSSVPSITTSASVSPEALAACDRRSVYLRESLNFSASTGRTSCPSSLRFSVSSRRSRRSRARSRMWCSHFGQTLRFFSSSVE